MIRSSNSVAVPVAVIVKMLMLLCYTYWRNVLCLRTINKKKIKLDLEPIIVSFQLTL